MECVVCGQPAQGVCRFCGRALCKEHFRSLPFPQTVYVGKNNTPKAIVIGDAVFCGMCNPQPEPLEMPEIY